MPPTKKTKLASGAGSNVLSGLTFAISGPLSQPRKHWEELITSNGAHQKVQYLITTEGEIAVDTVKIQTARVKGLPMVSEEFVSDAVSTGGLPDVNDYLLKGSPVPKSSGKKTATKVAPAPTRAVKAKATLEEADEEEEEAAKKPAKRGAAKATSSKVTAAKATSARGAAKSTAAAKEEPEEKEAKAEAKEEKAKSEPAARGASSELTLSHAASSLDMTPKRSEVVFSFDTTGSMYPCLTQVRRKINECVERLFKEIGADNLRIGITAHGDYCDAGRTYVTKHLQMTSDIKKIVHFVENVEATGGGDAPECYELVLHEALSFPWTEGWTKVLVLIGDELPHEANSNPSKLDWKEECAKLKDKGVIVHGVQALNRKHATKFYAAVSNLTGGVHLPLDQFSSIADLVMAVCYREARPAQLETFEKEVQAQGRYNRSVRTMFDRMLGRSATAGAAPGDMNAVPAGRFQVLDVDRDTSIKDFVLAQGVTFKTGRGFYEFTKKETIQSYKEIILMDPSTGDMFEGDYARTLLNLPIGANATVSPSEYDYIVFVQSTSYNRKLIGGTKFLYEVEET